MIAKKGNRYQFQKWEKKYLAVNTDIAHHNIATRVDFVIAYFQNLIHETCSFVWERNQKNHTNNNDNIQTHIYSIHVTHNPMVFRNIQNKLKGKTYL